MDRTKASFIVQTAALTSGGTSFFVAGYETEAEANDSVAERNARAVDMGIVARYEVAPAN